jgi:bacterioferritin-associated ferredoxin
MDSNPLAKFFRQPAIYVRLPSQGRNWRPNTIQVPASGEIPVLPMTAIDEISYRTPDALFNGEAVTGVIQSCVPAVKDAWATPGTDLDVLLVAIRIASYGHSMDIGSVCPSCGEDHEFGLDLRTVIDNLKPSDFDQPMTMGDLTFYFRPLTYREMTNNSLQQFEQQKTLQMVNQSEEIPESEKITKMNAMMKSLVEVTVKDISQSITEIRTPGAIVTEQAHIEEFITNCDRTIFNAIRDFVIKLRESSELRPLEITCPSCSHQYQQIFTLDMANFFVAAS